MKRHLPIQAMILWLLTPGCGIDGEKQAPLSSFVDNPYELTYGEDAYAIQVAPPKIFTGTTDGWIFFADTTGSVSDVTKDSFSFSFGVTEGTGTFVKGDGFVKRCSGNSVQSYTLHLEFAKGQTIETLNPSTIRCLQ